MKNYAASPCYCLDIAAMNMINGEAGSKDRLDNNAFVLNSALGIIHPIWFYAIMIDN
jgi:hypothetical protein